MNYKVEFEKLYSKKLEQLGPTYHKELYALVRREQPLTVVETGTYHGASTLTLLAALVENANCGVLLSFETDSRAFRVTSDLIPLAWRSRWKFYDHSVLKFFNFYTDPLAIDLFLHDSDHSYANMLAECKFAWQNLNCGGWLVVDDVHWGNVKYPHVATAPHNAFSDFLHWANNPKAIKLHEQTWAVQKA